MLFIPPVAIDLGGQTNGGGFRAEGGHTIVNYRAWGHEHERHGVANLHRDGLVPGCKERVPRAHALWAQDVRHVGIHTVARLGRPRLPRLPVITS